MEIEVQAWLYITYTVSINSILRDNSVKNRSIQNNDISFLNKLLYNFPLDQMDWILLESD